MAGRDFGAAPATLEALLRAYEMTGEPGWMQRADRSLPLLGGLPFLRTEGFNCDTRARCSILARQDVSRRAIWLGSLPALTAAIIP